MADAKQGGWDPTPHLMKLKGDKLYLPVKYRVVWLRAEYPDAVIETEMVHCDWDLRVAVFRARVTIPGNGAASGYGSESEQDFPAGWIEKAETKAIGRAVALLGFGTQFAEELDEGERLADSPVQARTKATSTKTTQPAGGADQRPSATPPAPGASATAKDPVEALKEEIRGQVDALGLAQPGNAGDWKALARDQAGMDVPEGLDLRRVGALWFEQLRDGLVPKVTWATLNKDAHACGGIEVADLRLRIQTARERELITAQQSEYLSDVLESRFVRAGV